MRWIIPAPATRPDPSFMNLHALRDFLRLFAERFTATRCPQVAGSLAFTTLLALVPLIAVTLGVFGNLPGMDQLGASLKSFLLNNLLPDRAGRIITTYALQFSQKAGQLTLIGTGLLAFTALLLLGTIEKVFNLIWGVRRPRPMLMRITVSWFVLTLGPIVFGASVIATGYLVTTSMEWSDHLPWIGEVAARVLPPLLLGALFSFLYYAVPNHPVRPLHAIAGGLAAALVFFLMQRAFGMFIASFPTYTLIYGTFAALPIFLIWLYLSWIVVLLGALVAAMLPAFLERQRITRPFPGDRAWAAIGMLAALGHAQQSGQAASFEMLRGSTGLAEHTAETLLDGLREAGWATRTEDGDWVLTQTPCSIHVRSVIERFALDPVAWLDTTTHGASATVARRLQEGLAASDMTLDELLIAAPEGPTDPTDQSA
jgi:membrane protein